LQKCRAKIQNFFKQHHKINLICFLKFFELIFS
jgi:hypothetical protein